MRVKDELPERIGEQKYERWFSSSRLEYDNGCLTVTVPSRFEADWIRRHYQDDLVDIAGELAGDRPKLELVIEPRTSEKTGPGLPRRPSPPVPSAPPRRKVEDSSGRPALRYTLDDFIVGPFNQLAYTAGCRLVDHAAADLNPLFVYGGCGVGKTHLLQGLCQRFIAHHEEAKWLYTTAEQFTNDFITAIRSNKLDAMRHRLRQLDLLVVDDVHFMAQKSATQSEFLHTFDAIDLHGAKVIMASDAHPKLIEQFNEALISRFMQGMVARVDNPDVASRRRLLAALADRRGMKLTDEAIELLGDQAEGSIREIEGLLTRLGAVAELLHPQIGTGTLGLTAVEQMLGIHHRAQPRRPVRFEHILDTVTGYLGVERSGVFGRSRHPRIVAARSMTAYLAREMTTLSFPELARRMNRTNHSTVVTASQRIRQQINSGQRVKLPPDIDTTTDALIDRLRQAVLKHAAEADRRSA
jgi:chromosomal replication initiator protein